MSAGTLSTASNGMYTRPRSLSTDTSLRFVFNVGTFDKTVPYVCDAMMIAEYADADITDFEIVLDDADTSSVNSKAFRVFSGMNEKSPDDSFVNCVDDVLKKSAGTVLLISVNLSMTQSVADVAASAGMPFVIPCEELDVVVVLDAELTPSKMARINDTMTEMLVMIIHMVLFVGFMIPPVLSYVVYDDWNDGHNQPHDDNGNIPVLRILVYLTCGINGIPTKISFNIL
jgi:hypothetical protein